MQRELLIVLAATALLLPLLTALLLAVAVPIRHNGWAAAAASVATAGLAALAAIRLCVAVPATPLIWSADWLRQTGRSLVAFGLRIDGISATMLVVVTLVALCVQVFSLGYMKQESRPALGRYFTYHSLFIFSMNLLVLAPNVLQFFIGWELVGLTSYLLIGFYYQKPSAGHAAVKAFWMTKLADMGFLFGLLCLFWSSNGFEMDAQLEPAAATAVTIGLFIAVMGKSAQFPLHVWLPNAMEGPTPVSALLHAATMVAAGVFLLVRFGALFAQAPVTMDVMLWVGSFTAIFAALIAVVQTDIKRVLAYSTCSQLGYMVAAAGAGAIFPAYFHLTTHAFFKALLFLAAGSVIHAVHSNELKDMGGLGKRMPVTTAAFAVGALALIGFPGFSGFFSKDAILEGVVHRQAWLPLTFLVLSVGLTAFYMTRTFVLAFLGPARAGGAHAHESPISMTLPLMVLGVGALAAGWFGQSYAGLVAQSYHFEITPVGSLATLFALGGLLVAWVTYAKRTGEPSMLRRLDQIVQTAWVDRFYAFGLRGIALPLARGIGWFDRYVVDGLVNATGWCGLVVSRRLQRLQTGNTLDYLAAVVAGALAILACGALR